MTLPADREMVICPSTKGFRITSRDGHLNSSSSSINSTPLWASEFSRVQGLQCYPAGRHWQWYGEVIGRVASSPKFPTVWSPPRKTGFAGFPGVPRGWDLA